MSIDSIHDIHEQCHGGTVSLSVWNEVIANCRNLTVAEKVLYLCFANTESGIYM